MLFEHLPDGKIYTDKETLDILLEGAAERAIEKYEEKKRGDWTAQPGVVFREINGINCTNRAGAMLAKQVKHAQFQRLVANGTIERVAYGWYSVKSLNA